MISQNSLLGNVPRHANKFSLPNSSDGRNFFSAFAQIFYAKAIAKLQRILNITP